MGDLPSGMEKSLYRDSPEVDLKPWLLAAALALLLFDLFLSFFLRGLFIRRVPGPGPHTAGKTAKVAAAFR